jgi:hypothetical protein
MKYVCDSYLGMDKAEIDKIKSLDSRAVSQCVLRTETSVLVSVSTSTTLFANNKAANVKL